MQAFCDRGGLDQVAPAQVACDVAVKVSDQVLPLGSHVGWRQRSSGWGRQGAEVTAVWVWSGAAMVTTASFCTLVCSDSSSCWINSPIIKKKEKKTHYTPYTYLIRLDNCSSLYRHDRMYWVPRCSKATAIKEPMLFLLYLGMEKPHKLLSCWESPCAVSKTNIWMDGFFNKFLRNF